MENEIWKDIAGFEGLYQVSSLGNVKSISRKAFQSPDRFRVIRERILKSYKDKKGYLMVKLFKPPLKKTIKVHRLVCVAFHENPENKPEVNHKDGDKNNCRSDNLEWATGVENAAHAMALGLRRWNRGIQCWNAILTEPKVRKIKELLAKKVKSRTIAKKFGISLKHLNQIKHHRLWSHVK